MNHEDVEEPGGRERAEEAGIQCSGRLQSPTIDVTSGTRLLPFNLDGNGPFFHYSLLYGAQILTLAILGP